MSIAKPSLMPSAEPLVPIPMKLIVGLGNPGSQYDKTRHNAGFAVVDRLVAKFGGGQVAKARFQAVTVEATIAGEKTLLMKPTTYMNRSGQSVAEALRFFKAEAATDLLVITDEVYLPTGVIRMKPGGGTAGHNGLANIQQLLGTDQYPRLRVGVGLLPSGGKPSFMDQADFVLGRFSDEEQTLLEQALKKSTEACELFVSKGPAHAMNFANAGEKPEKKPEKKEPLGEPRKPMNAEEDREK
jgi:peptidyl-tRNA hydrolase, PTH1 family